MVVTCIDVFMLLELCVAYCKYLIKETC